MFSCSSFSSQIGAALYQIPTVVNQVRTKTLGLSSTHVPSHKRKKRGHVTMTRNSETSVQNIQEILALCNLHLNKDDLRIISHNINSAELLSVCEGNPLRREMSHVSSHTFFENKTGFPESVLKVNFLSLSPSQRPMNHLLSPALHNIRHEQRRYFETKRRKEEQTVEKEETKKTTEVLNELIKRIRKWLIYSGIVIALFYLLFRNIGAAGVRVNITGSPIQATECKTRFSDVQGCYEAKQELQDIVDFLKNPDAFTSMGAKLPKGVLLNGPPGVGKTLLARAVAGEAKVAFFQVKGSEFDEIFVGSGARKIRNLFATAKKMAPCVIFIDELDSVGSKRSNTEIQPYANQTINQLLAEMDGFEANTGVIVMGATNRREFLDSAIVRSGRFDVEVKVEAPSLRERVELFNYYLSKPNIVTDHTVNVDDLARNSVGMTGADIENMVNQAALHATLRKGKCINSDDIEYARDKMQLGPAKKFKIPDAETNIMTAFHEAGHTLVSVFTKHAIPLYKVTIQPRGRTMGHTAFSDKKDKYSHSKAELLAQMDVAMGGRVAEEIIYGSDKVGTGASADFMMATSIAKRMVEHYGMSDKIGPIVFTPSDKLSPAMQEQIDKEVKLLLSESYERAKSILTSHKEDLKKLANALMEYETLDSKDVQAVLAGKMRCPTNHLKGFNKQDTNPRYPTFPQNGIPNLKDKAFW